MHGAWLSSPCGKLSLLKSLKWAHTGRHHSAEALPMDDEATTTSLSSGGSEQDFDDLSFGTTVGCSEADLSDDAEEGLHIMWSEEWRLACRQEAVYAGGDPQARCEPCRRCGTDGQTLLCYKCQRWHCKKCWVKHQLGPCEGPRCIVPAGAPLREFYSPLGPRQDLDVRTWYDWDRINAWYPHARMVSHPGGPLSVLGPERRSS